MWSERKLKKHPERRYKSKENPGRRYKSKEKVDCFCSMLTCFFSISLQETCSCPWQSRLARSSYESWLLCSEHRVNIEDSTIMNLYTKLVPDFVLHACCFFIAGNRPVVMLLRRIKQCVSHENCALKFYSSLLLKMKYFFSFLPKFRN